MLIVWVKRTSIKILIIKERICRTVLRSAGEVSKVIMNVHDHLTVPIALSQDCSAYALLNN